MCKRSATLVRNVIDGPAARRAEAQLRGLVGLASAAVGLAYAHWADRRWPISPQTAGVLRSRCFNGCHG